MEGRGGGEAQGVADPKKSLWADSEPVNDERTVRQSGWPDEFVEKSPNTKPNLLFDKINILLLPRKKSCP
jgi:hypothetical protein